MAALRCSAFRGRLTCGHCCALAAQPPDALAATLDVARAAGLTVVSLPAVNLWLQDRDGAGKRTPRRRGVTLLKELADAGVPVALASDNTRDQFYAYGDLDMLDVFKDAVRIGHLDRPFGEWPAAITTTPARAMGLPADFATFCPGAPAVRTFLGCCNAPFAADTRSLCVPRTFWCSEGAHIASCCRGHSLIARWCAPGASWMHKSRPTTSWTEARFESKALPFM